MNLTYEYLHKYCIHGYYCMDGLEIRTDSQGAFPLLVQFQNRLNSHFVCHHNRMIQICNKTKMKVRYQWKCLKKLLNYFQKHKKCWKTPCYICCTGYPHTSQNSFNKWTKISSQKSKMSISRLESLVHLLKEFQLVEVMI